MALTKEERMQFIRQSEIINMDKLSKMKATIIGAGSVGSFTALTLAKMGIGGIRIFDEDGVSDTNLPAQFYRKQDVGQFKVDALKGLLEDFTEKRNLKTFKRFYTNQRLDEVVIVCTDNMASRKTIWNQFLSQPQARYLIDSRMGAELVIIYSIEKKPKEIELYQDTLHDDSESNKLPCTARTIIYNVLADSALICRAVKAIVQDEKFPRETVFNMTSMNPYSLMLRDE